ncbi:hypothetical protein ACBY01_02590 [Sphingomonas sp. ac-8]|uniref:hypothetical protein n=1 Tax=Sphingomonas sp. ac-8 TaxID=3242977 RepID=UPI003A7FD6F6
MRPKSIQRFDQFYLGALVVGLVNTAVTWNVTMAQLQAQPATAAIATPMIIGTTVLSIGISLLLWFFTSRMRSTVTKWIITVFFVFGALMVVWSLLNGQFPSVIGTVLALLATVMQGIAVYMLFQPDAVAWFKGEPTGDPATPFE